MARYDKLKHFLQNAKGTDVEPRLKVYWGVLCHHRLLCTGLGGLTIQIIML